MFAFEYIDTTTALDDFVAELEGASRLAIDMERNQFHGYNVRVCLLQIATPHHIGLIDIEVLPKNTIEKLRPFLESPTIEKILHGADNDLISFKQTFNFQLGHLFDTFIAARFLGLPQKNLAALLEHYFSLKTSKEYQKLDWSKRPIPQKALEYAAIDVVHLAELWDILAEELEKQGWLDAAIEESLAMLNHVPTPKPFDADQFIHIRGAQELDPYSLNILKELYLWRHKICSEIDRSPFFVLKDWHMIKIAKRQPKSRRQLQRLIPPQDEASHYLSDLWQLISKASQHPLHHPPPKTKRKKRTPKNQPELDKNLMKYLKEWRNQRAKELPFQAGLLFPNSLLEQIARYRPTSVEALSKVQGMTSWRLKRYASEILSIISG